MSTSAPITISSNTWADWKKSARKTLDNFTDAAREALVRKIIDFEKESARDREVQQAQFATRMAELNYRTQSVADLERRLAERLAALKDGPSIDIDAVRTVVREHVEQILAGWDRPKDGTSVSLDDVRPVIAELVAQAIATLRAEHQQNEVRAQHWTPPEQTRWQQSPIIDVDAEVDSTASDQRPQLRLITEAVALLPRRVA